MAVAERARAPPSNGAVVSECCIYGGYIVHVLYCSWPYVKAAMLSDSIERCSRTFRRLLALTLLNMRLHSSAHFDRIRAAFVGWEFDGA